MSGTRRLQATPVVEADVCVYAATPSGILAAVAVAREGKTAVIVEPSRWVGGILGAGLKPTQDCPNIRATGGMTRTLLPTLGRPMEEHEGETARGSAGLAALNPADIRRDFLQLLERHGVRVIGEHRVHNCRKNGTAIQSVTFDLAPFDSLGCPVAEPQQAEALRVSAKVFIDASYEGDLMARAGVSYRVGRESADAYDEPLAGVRPPTEEAPIDPFIIPGEPASGLLSWVEDDHKIPTGGADHYTQAYNYRFYTTSDPAHRMRLTPPADYDPTDFELIGRYVEYLVETIDEPETLQDRLSRIFPGWNNSGVWNYRRESLFSMAPVGVSHLYADGDYATKARIWKLHQDYLRGLHHFLSTDRRVPESFREEFAALGLDGRHHRETGGWPHQLYIRVTRRMRGRYTVTAHDVYNRTTVVDPVGLAQYGIDTYPARRIWLERNGLVLVGLEGKMFIGGPRGPTHVPYPISYRAITPQARECTNLLVPVCLSATHLGYASARMEPVFMICGESAGIAAVRAIEEDATVQTIDPAIYRRKLEEAGQRLEWNEPPAAAAYTFERLCRDCDRDVDHRVSRPEWSAGKPGWDWLFPLIDRNGDGGIESAEYAAFQEFKKRNPDWRDLRPRDRTDH